MTAEVAILNKLAVALAADSTVTISSAEEKHKTFESADKLFELSATQPLGVMFFGDGHYMDMPVGVLVKEFRRKRLDFNTVSEARDSFLSYLQTIGKDSPSKLKVEHTLAHILPFLNMVFEGAFSDLQKVALESFKRSSDGEYESEIDSDQVYLSAVRRRILTLTHFLEGREDAAFVGGEAPKRLTKALTESILSNVERAEIAKSGEIDDLVLKVSRLLIRKDTPDGSPSGLVFAGFGEDEIFPSMHSCMIDGFIRGKLKYRHTQFCDIDRMDRSAAVYGFAQRDVLERFLYGFDGATRKHIVDVAKWGMASYLKDVIDALKEAGASDELVEELLKRNQSGVEEFEKTLETDGFENVVATGRNEIEDLVRFMPKPDLAEMAESLVNLTSMKRRVSKGMETVGGPVDVAVISKSEGFVWVKRKHYFDSKYNHRFFTRKGFGQIG